MSKISPRPSKEFVITGANSGLGLALIKELVSNYTVGRIIGFGWLRPGETLDPIFNLGRVEFISSDFNEGRSGIERAINANKSLFGEYLDVLVNCAGVNLIDWLPHLEEADVERLYRVNTFSVLYMTQAMLPLLQSSPGGGTVLNVVSNAYRMPMTHSWIYNGTKGAAAIATRQMARELEKTHGICVFGICPNKMSETQMSEYIEGRVCEMRGWTKEEAAKYQAQALVPGFETKTEWIAELLAWLLIKPRRHKYLSGCLLETGY